MKSSASRKYPHSTLVLSALGPWNIPEILARESINPRLLSETSMCFKVKHTAAVLSVRMEAVEKSQRFDSRFAAFGPLSKKQE